MHIHPFSLVMFTDVLKHADMKLKREQVIVRIESRELTSSVFGFTVSGGCENMQEAGRKFKNLSRSMRIE